MENPCDFVIHLSDMHKLSYTRKIGLLNFSEWETIKTTYFWQTCIGPESNLKNICFHHSYLEKDLRSVTTNVAMYLTPIKTEEYPTPPSAKTGTVSIV